MTPSSPSANSDEPAKPFETQLLRFFRYPLVVALVGLAAYAWGTGTQLSQSVATDATPSETFAQVAMVEQPSTSHAPESPMDIDSQLQSDALPAATTTDDSNAQAENPQTQPYDQQDAPLSTPVEAATFVKFLKPTHLASQLKRPATVASESVAKQFRWLARTWRSSPAAARRPLAGDNDPKPSPLVNKSVRQAEVPAMPADIDVAARTVEPKVVPANTSLADDPKQATDPQFVAEAKPAVEPASLLLINAAGNHAAIHFVANGQVQTVAPGKSYRLKANGPWRIQFHRGGEFGNADQILSTGTYRFHVTERGWALDPAEDA